MDKFQLAKFMSAALIGSSFIAGALLVGAGSFIYSNYFSSQKIDTSKFDVKPDVKVSSYLYTDGKMTAFLSDGQIIQPESFRKLSTGIEVFYHGKWIGASK